MQIVNKDIMHFKVYIFWEGHKVLTACTVVKSKGKISQNFVAFSEYMNFNLKEEGEYYSDQIVEESYESLNELT